MKKQINAYDFVIVMYPSCLDLDEEYVETILKWMANRIDKLSDLVKNELAFVWVIPNSAVPLDEKHLIAVTNFMRALEVMDSLEKETLKGFLKCFAQENDVKYATLMKLLRSLLSGLKVN